MTPLLNSLNRVFTTVETQLKQQLSQSTSPEVLEAIPTQGLNTLRVDGRRYDAFIEAGGPINNNLRIISLPQHGATTAPSYLIETYSSESFDTPLSRAVFTDVDGDGLVSNEQELTLLENEETFTADIASTDGSTSLLDDTRTHFYTTGINPAQAYALNTLFGLKDGQLSHLQPDDSLKAVTFASLRESLEPITLTRLDADHGIQFSGSEGIDTLSSAPVYKLTTHIASQNGEFTTPSSIYIEDTNHNNRLDPQDRQFADMGNDTWFFRAVTPTP
jgi:hypothetical protein